MKKKEFNNVIILAENEEYETGFNIYIVFSGKKEYLLTHRHQGDIYKLLSPGITLSELKRNNPRQLFIKHRIRKNVLGKSINSLNHIISIIDWYIKDLEAADRYDEIYA